MDIPGIHKDIETRLEYLEEIHRFTVDALEMAASLGDFQNSINNLHEPSALMKETGIRVKSLIPLEICAFYLVEERGVDLHLADCEPGSEKESLKEEVEFLIDNGTIAWALRENRAIAVSTRDFKRQIILHVMATYSRIRGLFVGILRPGEKDIPEFSLLLLSIVLLNSANALESFESHRMVQKAQEDLEERVRERTLKLSETNEKLQIQIAERERTEEALREGEKRFKELFHNAPVGYHELDTEGHITRVNRKELEMLGYNTEEMIGQPIWKFVAEEEQSRQSITAKLSGSMQPGRNFERTYIRKDGTTVPVSIEDALIRDGEEKIIGIHSTIQDITERKRMEEERKSLEAHIQRMEKMEALGTLAGGVAHDLNNILSGLIGYPDLILMELPDDSPLRESILAIKRSGERAAAIVQDLLTLARRGVVSVEVMNWNRVISDYMKTPEQEKIQLFHPDVRFEVLLESDLLPVKGSPVHLSKVVMNLLSNAAEAIRERGVVTISTRNEYLDRSIKGYDHVMEGDYVVLEVSDTGRGIPKEDMGKIFEPFYTKKVMGRSGTGLGLAVVWGTVKDHKGYIDVQSEEGRGTTFRLYFPVTRESLPLDQPLISPSDYMGKGETILVVDDVMEQRSLAVAMLSKLNYQATSVSSGEAAIEYMKTHQVDLLILDMIMDPGIDGLETYRRIIELYPGQKAVIVSGFAETERVRQVLELGAGAFVRKPYVMEKIGLEIRRELDK